MIAGHNMSIWRTPVTWGWLLEVRCRCGYRATHLATYEEAELIATDHTDEMRRLQELEREEQTHA